MKLKELVLIGVLGFSLSGCMFIPALVTCIPRPYVEHPNSIKLDYYDNSGWWDYGNLSLIRKRIKDYLVVNKGVDPAVRTSLENLSFQEGMTKEQITLVIGNPKRKKVLKNKNEQWTYSGAKGGVLQWYYRWGKLSFSKDRLIDIEVQNVEMCDL